jgi:hypothetical protein
MKTPMQELLEKVQYYRNSETSLLVISRLNSLCVDILEMLNKERQVIENAFLDGYTHSPDDGFPEYARNYYNEIFNAKEK